MSSRTSDDRAASRAEARRRRRLAARGELPDQDPEPAEATGAEPRRSFLHRLFPPAPPLPNRPDPLAGFDRSGPLTPVRERAFLLRRNLLAWIIPGIFAFVGYLASVFYGAGLLGLLGTFLLFGSLIAAGWFGWQRPSLFGTAASLVAYVLTTALLLYQLSVAGADAAVLTPVGVILDLTLRALYQAGLGFLGGWYGGYLRRRQAHINETTRRRR